MSQFPDDENGAVLQSMAERGLDLVSPRRIDFEHCFPNEAAARGFLAAIEGTVRRAKLFAPSAEDDRGWEVKCCELMVPTHPRSRKPNVVWRLSQRSSVVTLMTGAL